MSAAALVLLAFGQGCTKENATSDATAVDVRRCADPSVFSFTMYDYVDPTERDPATFIANRHIPLVVSGVVEEVLEGPAVPAANDPDMPQEDLYVAVKIAVDQEYVALDRSRIHDGFVYVIARRGPYSEPGWTPFPMARWNLAVPHGTRVVAFLGTPHEGIDAALAGRWARTPPMAGVRNGMVLESCGRVLNTIDLAGGPGWTFASLEELETTLAAEG